MSATAPQERRDLEAIRDGVSEHGPTLRQARVLMLLAAGRTTKDIAWSLGIGQGAVKKHVARLAQRYRAPNRIAMVIAAIRAGDLVITTEADPSVERAPRQAASGDQLRGARAPRRSPER